FFYRLAEDYTRGFSFQRHFVTLTGNRSFTIDGLTEGIHHAAYHAFAYFNRSDLAGTAHFGTFLNVATLTHEYHTHVVFFQVQCNSAHTILKFHQLTIAHITQSIYTGNTIAHLQYRAHLFQVGACIETAQLLTQYGTYFIGFNF